MTMPLVVLNPSRNFFPWIKAGQVHASYKYGEKGKIAARAFRKIGLPALVDRTFGDWIKALKQGRKVVFMDAAIDLKMLERLAPYKRNVIVYMWNPVQLDYYACVDLLKYKDVFTFYSHDRSDCAKYGFQFNTGCYASPPAWVAPPIAHDLVYLGRAKGRVDEIVSTYNQLQGLRRDYYIFDAKNAGTQIAEGLFLQGDFLSYTDYLKRVMASRAVLEVMQQGQDSLTLRVMESLYFRKKLITNYQNIVHENFYRPANILVYQSTAELTRQKVEAFLDQPHETLDPALIHQFDFANWIQRFE